MDRIIRRGDLPERTLVPDLIGQDWATVVTAVQQRALSVDFRDAGAVVADQRPAAGTEVPGGSMVTVWFAQPR